MKTKRKSIRRGVFLAIFGISITVNLVFLRYDVYEFVKPKLFSKDLTISERTPDIDLLEDEIVEMGFKMARSPNVSMVWHEPTGVSERIYGLFSTRNSKEFQKFNFPRAFLLFGLAEYCKSEEDERMKEVKRIFDEYIDIKGEPQFLTDKVDQVVFGLTALTLYEVYKEDKYLHFSNILYRFINSSTNSQGLVLYRKKQTVIFVDTLGMIIPFLVKYYQVTGDEAVYELAKRQMDYYIENGLDKDTYLPVHAFNNQLKIKVGSSNWGRGIGWYYIALAHINGIKEDYRIEMDGIRKSVDLLKMEDGLWTQFPGSSKRFDASASTMFLYAGILSSPTTDFSAVITNLSRYVDDNGALLETSGDTYSANNYSKTFGKSELSQGCLILFLSNFRR